MIYLAFVNYLIIISIFGYSYLLKSVIFKNKDNNIFNHDFFYGLIFLYFLSILAHIFLPLKFFTNIVLILGLIIFILLLIKKKIKISLTKYALIVFIFSIISYYGLDNVDSPLYHLQIIKWMYEHKLTFGLANLEYRLGVNYPWYSIISLININFLNFSNKYYVSLIIFSFLFYEAINQKKVCKSVIFLSLSLSYLFIFSLIHPYNYGVVLNHIGNPEKDLFNMLLFIFIIYLFLRISESQEEIFKVNLISIMLICMTILLMQMPIYFFLLINLVIIYIKFVKVRDYTLLILLLIIISILWMLKSIAINGCLVFPINFTCLNTEWTIDLSFLNYMVDETKRYSRSLPSLQMLNDNYRTLETFLWLKPWLKNYFLTTAMHQINLLIYIFSIILIIYLILKKKFKLILTDTVLFTSILLVNLICIIIIPEIRYYWGPHISLSIFLLTIVIFSMNINIIRNRNFYSACLLLPLFLFIFFKVYPKIEIKDLVVLPERAHDFSKKKKLGIFNGFEVFTNSWQCADMNEICVNIPKENYNFIIKNTYLIIKN